MLALNICPWFFSGIPYLVSTPVLHPGPSLPVFSLVWWQFSLCCSCAPWVCALETSPGRACCRGAQADMMPVHLGLKEAWAGARGRGPGVVKPSLVTTPRHLLTPGMTSGPWRASAKEQLHPDSPPVTFTLICYFHPVLEAKLLWLLTSAFLGQPRLYQQTRGGQRSRTCPGFLCHILALCPSLYPTTPPIVPQLHLLAGPGHPRMQRNCSPSVASARMPRGQWLGQGSPQPSRSLHDTCTQLPLLCSQGLRKRELLKELLPVIGQNLRFQRLFTECQEQLDILRDK